MAKNVTLIVEFGGRIKADFLEVGRPTSLFGLLVMASKH
jgi:hypothetical protein